MTTYSNRPAWVDIMGERAAQDEKWGEQNHDDLYRFRWLADGLAPRVDQLRVIGNGVCPLAAAYAFCALWAAAFGK